VHGLAVVMAALVQAFDEVDEFANFAGYVPVGALVYGALVRSGRPVGPSLWWAWAVTAGLSYSDVEGSVVWVQEYLRYRLNLCSHEQAVERVRIQIAGGGVPGVCGTPASASVIAFPPRNETYGFRLQLEDFYKTDLARAAVKTSVDAEGDVVWIQEYLRYRLNGCTHAQSIDKVTQQIDGRGVPGVCK